MAHQLARFGFIFQPLSQLSSHPIFSASDFLSFAEETETTGHHCRHKFSPFFHQGSAPYLCLCSRLFSFFQDSSAIYGIVQYLPRIFLAFCTNSFSFELAQMSFNVCKKIPYHYLLIHCPLIDKTTAFMLVSLTLFIYFSNYYSLNFFLLIN